MNLKLLYSAQAARTELIVLMLEKWGLHPQLQEKSATPNLDDLERDADVMIPEAEFERAKEILFGESEFEQAGF